MDFKKYYMNQSGSSFPIFHGAHFQRGFGIGGVFRRLFSWFIPILKEHALPVSKNIGKEVIKSTAKFANELIDGKHDFLKTKNETGNNQDGNGYKRKRNLNLIFKKHKKKKSSIFSKI